MPNYKTLIAIHGLRSGNGAKQPVPVAEGEVIALPDDLAGGFLHAGFVAITDEPVTLDLAFSLRPIATVQDGGIAPDDRQALIDALTALDCEVIPAFSNGALDFSTLAPDVTLGALRSGLRDGRIALSDVSLILTNEQMLNDLAWRMAGNGLDPETVRALLPPVPGVDAPPPAADLGDAAPPAASEAPAVDTTAQPAARGKAKQA